MPHKKRSIRNRKGQYTRRRYEERDIMGRFSKKRKKPPVRYRRPVPDGFMKAKTTLKDKRIKTGQLLEFKYGKKQKPGQVGGWKNDPRPVLLVFHDDRIRYIEGINTNYLSDYYLKKLRVIMRRFPGVDGEFLYNIFRRTARFALKKGYRKYIRSSFRDMYLYVYEDEIERTLDELAKDSQTDFGVADRGKNAET